MKVSQTKKEYDSLSSTSKYTAWGLVVILLGGMAIYYKGKKSGNTFVPLPNNSNSTETEASIIRGLALALHNEMKGVGVNSSIDPFKDYLATTDRIFVSVYNDFNKMYQADGDGTLREWINGEYWGMFDNSNKTIKESITARMDNLNLQ